MTIIRVPCSFTTKAEQQTFIDEHITPLISDGIALFNALHGAINKTPDKELRDKLLNCIARLKPIESKSTFKLTPDELLYANLAAIKTAMQKLFEAYSEAGAHEQRSIALLLAKLHLSPCNPDNFLFESRRFQAGLNHIEVPKMTVSTRVAKPWFFSTYLGDRHVKTTDINLLRQAKLESLIVTISPGERPAPSRTARRTGMST